LDGRKRTKKVKKTEKKNKDIKQAVYVCRTVLSNAFFLVSPLATISLRLSLLLFSMCQEKPRNGEKKN